MMSYLFGHVSYVIPVWACFIMSYLFWHVFWCYICLDLLCDVISARACFIMSYLFEVILWACFVLVV